MKLGKFEIWELDTGRFKLDGGAMFGIIPRPLWQSNDPPDSSNRIELALRPLLVRTSEFTLLIDAGMGDKWSEKQKSQFDLRAELVTKTLAGKCLFNPDHVTHVLATHLHFDHCGGLTTRSSSNEMVASFPRAQVFVHEENLRWAENPNPREKGSYLRENWQCYKDSGQMQLVRSEPLEKKEILPNVWVIRSDGHTRGQQCVLLDGGPGQRLLFCADLIPTSSHLKTAWHMRYDIEPLVVMKEKQALLEEAARDGWTLYFEHDARGACAKVSRSPEGDYTLESSPGPLTSE